MKDRKNLEKIICYSAVVILAAQLSMNLFIADFKISIAVVFIPLFYFLTDAFPLIPVTFCSAFGVFALRACMYRLQTGTWQASIVSAFPETGFYICYGLLLRLYTVFLKKKDTFSPLAALPMVLIDYAANAAELLLRMQAASFTWKTQSGIFLIACLRTFVIGAVLTGFDRYRFLLLKQEHEDRYRRLLVLVSKLDGEIVWMRKNTALIEETMSTAYRLYEELGKAGTDPKYVTSALSVARDVHEIKKEYLLILKGMSEALDQEMRSDGMEISELFALLKESMTRMAAENGKKLSMTVRCSDRLYTDRQYVLMSIFRNLFNNAVEAAEGEQVSILVEQTSSGEVCQFEVTDCGPGIEEEYLEEVFEPGFSTKINYTTGEVSRGLGLNLVKDLVEDQLHGNIELTSVPGRTTFTIRIPRKNLEKRAETELG